MFILFGVLGIVWFVFWNRLVTEKPCDHPSISGQELAYIEQSLRLSSEFTIPGSWTKMMTSLPVYAIVIASFCQSWGYYLVGYYQGKYIRHRFSFMANKVRWKKLKNLFLTSLDTLGKIMIFTIF
jgi:hypothetical protein